MNQKSGQAWISAMKIFKVILIVTIFLNVAVSTFAVDITEVEVIGTGFTKQEAIYAGLIEAVRQVNGVKIASQTQTNFSYKEFSASQGAKQEEGTIAKNSINKDISSNSKGFVDKYDILDTRKEQNEWSITLLVSIPKYKTPGISPHSRRKIAIIPFRTTKSSYNFQGQQIPSSEISRQFTQKLVTEITQTRKFTVLDREYMEEFLQEKNLVLSADAPTSEQMKIGEVLGVDYLIIGTVTDASLLRTAHKIEMLNETTYKDQATFIADYRIMVMATRQIKWSDSIALTLPSKELKKLVPSKSSELIQQAMLDKAAEMIAQRAMENIYPIRISQLQVNGQFILNQGGTTVNSGDLLDVFRPGKKVIDQYTGESLGAAETWVATLQVVRVIPKMSYAKVTKGTMESIQEGYICRRTAIADDIRRKNGTTEKKEKKLKPKW